MTHPLVAQLRFTRSEWIRGLKDVTAEEAVRRFEPINSISWMIGHLAFQEQMLFIILPQGKAIAPEANKYSFGKPASTPPLDEVWGLWRSITKEADVYLDGVTSERLQVAFEWESPHGDESAGTQMLRVIHHYWYHLGESQAVRQLLGHRDLPVFVGSMEAALYTPE